MSNHRVLTPPRIAALVLVAAVLLGLAALAIVPGGDAVRVPSGAHAGRLTLKPCTYDTERGARPADCGTLVVPENRRDPKSRLIALPVKRIRARSDHPGPPVFRLEGGPGITNMAFQAASRFADRHDVVLVGYRGVDGSSKLDCPEVTDARRHAADLLAASALRASERALRDCARRLQDEGADLAGYSLPQRVEDLEAARQALGYGPVDLVSESAGTRTAMIYAWRHPASIHRSVMIGANPPGRFVWAPGDTARQLNRIDGTGRVAARMRRTAADMPRRWGPLRIEPGNARLAAFFGLMEATDAAAPLSAPATIDAWRAAAEDDDPSGLWLESLLSRVFFPRAEVWGDVAAVARADAAAARAHFAAERSGDSPIGDPGSEFLWMGGRLLDAWPAGPDDDAYPRVQDSAVPTLVISGERDGTTPAANATRDLMPHLSSGRQVVLPGFGHTVDFWNKQKAAGNRLVTGFLDTGAVDDSGYRRQAFDATPKFTQPGLARTVAGGIVAIVVVTALAFALVAVRVRRRGRLGAKGRVAARTAFALVAGFGGWFAGALLALTVLPSVPVDALLPALVSIGLPAAAATYLGWTDRSRGAATRRAALAASVAGALAGGLLGFAAVDSPLALLTTIPGAVAGANLALIALDLAAGRTAARSAPAEPKVAIPA